MDSSLLEILVDPLSKTALELETSQSGPTGEALEGTLREPSGRQYPIRNGIPRFVLTKDEAQLQTGESFGYKWRQRATYDSPHVHATARQWLVERYGFRNVEDMRGYFAGRRRVLDAGCGSGFSSSLWLDPTWRGDGAAEWVGVDFSAAIDVARERLGPIEGTHFLQADILQLPFAPGSFDAILSEGVLHHTPSTERAFQSLASLLRPGGELMFYVYRKKAPVREFTDDHIRSLIADLPAEEAWAALRPLTRLGQSLAELHAEVEVPEDIPYLGIKAGRYDVQRLIYWHFAKLFWNEKYSFEENNHINVDWYHPRYAHRHTEDEVRRWCAEAGLTIHHFDAQESGYTVRALRDGRN